jgi:hypothetical protein
MISNSDSSRLANVSYFAHRRSVISLTAVRLSSDLPPRQRTVPQCHVSKARGHTSPRQRLQCLRPTADKPPEARTERLAPVGDLQRAVLDRSLGALHPPRSVPVAIACARPRPTGIVIPSQGILGVALQCPFDDQPRSEAHELRTPVLDLAPTSHQRLQLLACPLGCGYLLHRGAPS